MPTLYTENSEKWKSLADVDYFTQFVKAWIPFNAWYNNYYPNLNSDRSTINEIKSTSNNFRDRLLSLLSNTTNEAEQFRSHIAQLHYQLERKYIYVNNNLRLSFERIVVEKNQKDRATFSRNRCHYLAHRQQNQIVVKVTSQGGAVRFILMQTNYNISEIENHSQFANLSTNQQSLLTACYQEIDPFPPVSLLAHPSAEAYLLIDDIRFIGDKFLLCKGVIEILYQLRNALFHGQIIPDQQTNQVYEPAYHVLYMLVQAL